MRVNNKRFVNDQKITKINPCYNQIERPANSANGDI